MVLPPIKIEEAEVIDINELRKVPLLEVKRRPRTCLPHQFTIDGEERTVTCGKCKSAFDPIVALVEIARDWEHYRINWRNLRDEISRLEREREELQREVKNLRAQRRRLDVAKGGT